MNSALKPKFPTGVITAIVTPMDDRLNVNPDLLISHCRHLLTEGSDGIVLLGTTGEANSFSVDERMHILEIVIGGGIPQERIMIGTGCCAITDTITLTRHALAQGVHNVLMLPPFYYKPVSDEALFAYFARVIDSVSDEDLSIYLYHIPKNTGVDLSFGLISRLHQGYPGNIIGIKDSGGSWHHMASFIHEFPMLQMYSGTEEFLLQSLVSGGAGCISATANITASVAASVVRDFRLGKNPEEQQIHLTALRNLFSAYPFIGAIKGFLAKESGNDTWNFMRPPNEPVPKESIISLINEFNHLTNLQIQ